ncbi:Replication protein O [Bacillus velezensis]|uniref:Replication protein O n=1 Tax=Bacillus velezensis TaxID=492670 RepID=UPI003CF1DF04
MNGWIKLHRKIRSNPIFNDPQLLRLWLICLTEASHTEHDQIVGRQKIKLMPGEFVTGRFALMDMYNAGLKSKDRIKGEKTIFRWLEQLGDMGYLTIKKTNKFSIVSIDNWALYQEVESSDANSLTIKRPSKDHQMTTNKNVKKGKNEKNIKSSRLKYEICDMENAEYLFKEIQNNNPDAKKPNLEKWANEFRLIRERDKRTDQQIKYLINWSQQDSFWKTNILSPASLRKQFDRLVTKIKSDKEQKKANKAPRLNVEEFDLDD